MRTHDSPSRPPTTASQHLAADADACACAATIAHTQAEERDKLWEELKSFVPEGGFKAEPGAEEAADPTAEVSEGVKAAVVSEGE